MAKITIGESYDQSTTKLRAELTQSSQMELHVGAAHDMSVREINIIERETSEIATAVSRMRALLSEFETNNQGLNPKHVCREATVVADTAERIVRERKWYSVSGEGLLEAAKSVGEAASPLVASALKIIELLRQAKL